MMLDPALFPTTHASAPTFREAAAKLRGARAEEAPHNSVEAVVAHLRGRVEGRECGRCAKNTEAQFRGQA